MSENSGVTDCTSSNVHVQLYLDQSQIIHLLMSTSEFTIAKLKTLNADNGLNIFF